MTTKIFLALTALSLTIPAASLLRADEQTSSTETRLRQALREKMGELSDAQNQLVTLQAAQTQSDKDKTDLQAKIDALSAQLKTASDQQVADKAAAEKSISELTQAHETLVTRMIDILTSQVNDIAKPNAGVRPEVSREIDELKAQNPALAKSLDVYGADIQLWTDGYLQYVQFADKTEAARARLAGQAAQLQQIVTDRETKNLALYRLGGEILTRYERFGLGDALAAKEPFTGLARVKLENLVQDYKGKLLHQTVVSGQPPTVPATTPPTAVAPAATASR